MTASRLETLGLGRDLANRVVHASADGRYQLMCGAGTSLGAKGGDGKPLSLAKATANEIADVCGLVLEPDERNDLSLVYEEAKVRSKAKLVRYLLLRFTKCEPVWQAKFFELHWQRIWTLNIDDVLETAFAKRNDATRYGRVTSVSWRDMLKPVHLGDRELQIIHLHGIAERLRAAKDDVVFSLLEYSEVVRALQPWHAAFQTSYVEDPFIICGARLSEEPDFVVATRLSNQSFNATGVPSLIVAPSFTTTQEERLRRFGLVPLAAPAEGFMDALTADVKAYQRVYAASLSRYPAGVLERFSSQFRRLVREDMTSAIALQTDFYGGDQPTWHDVIAGRDVELQKTRLATGLLADAGPRVFVGVLYGSLASGKSAALLRLALAALAAGLQPYMFRNEELVDVRAVQAFLQVTPGAVLLFDDAADHTGAIGKLASYCSHNRLRLRVYAAERSHKVRNFRLDIRDEFRFEYHYRYLHDEDITALLVNRRAAGRLGKYSLSPDVEIGKLIANNWRRELLESLTQIEFGSGFRDRVSRYVDGELAAADIRSLVAAIACTHRFGFDLPLRVALPYLKSIDRLSSILEAGKNTEGIVVRDAAGIRLRHRIISEYIWKSVLTERERFDAILSVSLNLAPLINPATIAAKSRAHRIVRELLDQASLVNDVGFEARSLFARLEGSYSWSSRFWDQRALLEYRLESYTRAYSYSQKAVSLERHAFAFTTLGTICVKEAVRLASAEPIRARELYFEGEAALSNARQAAERQDMSFEHPFITFFSQTIRLLRSIPSDSAVFGPIEEVWGTWTHAARASECFRSQYGQDRINELDATWMKLRLGHGRSHRSDPSKTGDPTIANKPQASHKPQRNRSGAPE